MAAPGLPIEVESFLNQRIRSIEQLETLLLLRSAEGRRWTPAEVNREIRSSERSIAETLNWLCKQGLARRIGEGAGVAFEYSPGTDALKEAVAQTARLYAERRVKIVEAIYSERVSELDEFAKAFRLRKDPNA